MAHHEPIGLIAPNAGLAQLNERSRDIFRQIVESYLATGEPVGSRNISRLIAVPLASASVRNVMSDLEQLGLIYAPHTSAGRLPTELGLRFFVDALMQLGDLTEPERQSIQSQLASVGKAQSVEAALDEALTRLSGLTRAAAVVLTAKSTHGISNSVRWSRSGRWRCWSPKTARSRTRAELAARVPHRHSRKPHFNAGSEGARWRRRASNLKLH